MRVYEWLQPRREELDELPGNKRPSFGPSELAVDGGAQTALGLVIDRLRHILEEAIFFEIIDRYDQGGLDSTGCREPSNAAIGREVLTVAIARKDELPVKHVKGAVRPPAIS